MVFLLLVIILVLFVVGIIVSVELSNIVVEDSDIVLFEVCW